MFTASGSDSVIGREQLPQRNHIQVQHCQTPLRTASSTDIAASTFNHYQSTQSNDNGSRSPQSDSHAKRVSIWGEILNEVTSVPGLRRMGYELWKIE